MTNIYYRAIHLAGNAELYSRPAGLRMQGLTRHEIDSGDFELFGLATSVVKAYESCTSAHVAGALKHGISLAGVQAAIRIASVIHAAADVLDFPNATHSRSRPQAVIRSSQPATPESAN